jgi:hypothetical protein
MSLVTPTTVQQTTLGTKTKTFLEWDLFTPVLKPIPEHKTYEPKAKAKARGKLSLFEVEAFEAYWLKHVGDDSTPHDINDINTFFDGFDHEDERVHMKCHMFRIAQLAKSIAKSTPTNLAHLDAKAKAQAKAKAKAMKIPKCHLDSKWLEALAQEIAITTPKVLAHLDAKATAQAKANATKIPKCNLDSKWLERLAQEIATTTPKVLAHIDAKAQAKAKAKAKTTNKPFDNFWKFLAESLNKLQFANGRSQANSKRNSSTQNGSKSAFPQD